MNSKVKKNIFNNDNNNQKEHISECNIFELKDNGK